MRLISWNVNGIRAVQQRGQLGWLWESDNDIVCVQETKAHIEQLGPEITSPPGWAAQFSSGERKGYSGVATFVRDGLPCRVLTREMGVPHLDNEGRLLVTDHDAFVLMNVYFPNGGRGEERLRYKLAFYDAFSRFVQEFVDAGRDVIVCGDVNTAHRDIDVAQPDRHAGTTGMLPEERAWVDRFLESGFVDTFRAEHGDRPGQYTWWDMRTNARPDNLGWRIDYFFIHERLEECLVDAWISPQILGSDHCPVGLELDVELS